MLPETREQQCQLTLRFRVNGEQISVSWDSNILGHRVSRFTSPFNEETLPVVLRALDIAQQTSASPVISPFTTDEQKLLISAGLWDGQFLAPDVHQRVGRALYDALTADREAFTALYTVRNHAIANEQSVSYIFRFPPSAHLLAALPWEALWDEHGALMLHSRNLASSVRYLDLGVALPPESRSANRIHILSVTPFAGTSPSSREAEKVARNVALQPLIDSGSVTMEELRPATAKALVDRLHFGPTVDVLHFFGHGGYAKGRGFLLLDDEKEGRFYAAADRIAGLLSNIRLILLHASQSSMVGSAGLLTGLAPALSAAGVSAVVAMQLSIRPAAALRFAEVLYRSLARGEWLQLAMSKARQALYVEEEDSASWYVPTLTIRSREEGPIYLTNVAPTFLGVTPTLSQTETQKASTNEEFTDTTFVAGPALQHPRSFFGRAHLVQRIFSLLKTDPVQSALIIGPPRSGKTSLLNYLRNITQTKQVELRPDQRTNWLPNPSLYRWVFVDFTETYLGKREALMSYLLTALDIPIPEPCTIGNFLKAMSFGVKQPTVLLFDEIGRALERYPDLDDDVWTAMRALSQRTRGKVGFVLTSHTSPYSLMSPKDYDSPFLNIFGYTFELEPFSENEARQLIASSPIVFDEADIVWIIKQSECWPITLQALCDERLISLVNDERSEEWKTRGLRKLPMIRSMLGLPTLLSNTSNTRVASE